MKKKMFAGALPQIFENAKALRKNMTYAENRLWYHLKQKPLGYKFRRQHPIWLYIADFYCHKKKLVIELDGSIHSLEEVKQNDLYRKEMLKRFELTVLRFSNKEVLENVNLVLDKINLYLTKENNSSL